MRVDALLIGLVVSRRQDVLRAEGRMIDDVFCVDELVFASWTISKLHVVFCSYKGLGAP